MKRLILFTVLLVLIPAASASALINVNRFGFNTSGYYASNALKGAVNLGDATGAQWARIELIEGSTSQGYFSPKDTNAMTTYPAAGFTVYPMLGIDSSRVGSSYMADSNTLDSYLVQVINKYGPTGSYWSSCSCTAHPLTTYEIGNEVNAPPSEAADNTNLHYADDPGSQPFNVDSTKGGCDPVTGGTCTGAQKFAYVYRRARSTIIDNWPSGHGNPKVIVGGLADYKPFSIVTSWLNDFANSLNSEGVDGVGFHPYLSEPSVGGEGDVPTLESDVDTLRSDMNTEGHGLATATIDLNEEGTDLTQVTADFPADTGNYAALESDAGNEFATVAAWAFCNGSSQLSTPHDNIGTIIPEYYGGFASNTVPPAAPNGAEDLFEQGHYAPMLNNNGTETGYGTNWFGETAHLTSSGCSTTIY